MPINEVATDQLDKEFTIWICPIPTRIDKEITTDVNSLEEIFLEPGARVLCFEYPPLVEGDIPSRGDAKRLKVWSLGHQTPNEPG